MCWVAWFLLVGRDVENTFMSYGDRFIYPAYGSPGQENGSGGHLGDLERPLDPRILLKDTWVGKRVKCSIVGGLAHRVIACKIVNTGRLN